MATSDPKDIRYRPFRVAMYAVYIAVCAVAVVLIVNSVVRSVMRMTPRSLPPSEKTLSTAECVQACDQLWRDLDAQRQAFTRKSAASEADDEWVNFRVGWVKRLRETEAQCAVSSHGRVGMKKVFQQLETVGDLYTTHAVQYAGEVGPAVDKLVKSMHALKTQ